MIGGLRNLTPVAAYTALKTAGIAITMIQQDISARLFVPIELLLTESEDGERATFTYVLPSSLIAIEPGPSPLREVAEVLDAKFAQTWWSLRPESPPMA